MNMLNRIGKGWLRHDCTIWLGIVWAIVTRDFVLLSIMAVLAVLGSSIRGWENRRYKKLIWGYGTMVDEQQRIIAVHQYDHLHPSEKHAKARVARMN